ncbi:peptide ABC transporter substrate-binding protein [Erwinia sp. OLTSP20]|uniref:ABC transporter substrate-binding protein n=1 Tax=unclassified Erwinia TaxID=2622719 RepID=UPI000C187D35|nr:MULTISPECIES: ABC transporter substrate-binding protein [unclassified Erwinia]PIJ49405.1 peptide ABC transporter substrate-binding protein [Erwinia sp. OAMSP11]PIJ71081.1 peptide ABC transporter substrate-binding protein [Erwinia sp. OLSSP12]PIJ79359.1 peptide ABC transporter substrate-binding protein [Erwinia sp. OLCASP19]PIJ80897.1 peptide ABC transporter substrate-binding protein [Erwinia sp. OLMTSP26]PIJ83699.1 peptide ABC transporter substrate-binding protein [Erwinia sp. OLMDSP33]
MNRRELLKAMAVLAAGASGSMLLPGGLRMAVAAESGQKILRVQNDQDITNLDPANRSGWYDEMVMFAIYCGLCQYKPGTTWGWQLDAAETLEQVDPQTIRFKLKPGIMWSGDFGEMTAEDVKYSYERFLDPKLSAIYASDWEALDHVEVIGTYDGIIHLKHPFAPLFTSTLPHASGLIICKKALEASKDKKIGTDPLACAGPYRVGSWTPREKLTLTRNEKWHGPATDYDQIQLLPIGDLNTAEMAFEAGDLDMTKINLSAVAKYQDGGSDGTLTLRPALAYTWLGMNVDHPKLKDVRVRRAIQQAIDVASALNTTFGGAVKPAYGLVPPPLPGARSKNNYPYSVEAAKALLKQAGVSGLQLRLDFSTSTDIGTLAQVIQAQLAEVGITLQINQMDGATFVAAGQQSAGDGWKDSQLRITTFTTAPDPSWVTAWFTCSQVGIWNTQRTCDKSWDQLNSAAAVEQDAAKRAAMYVQLQDQLEETGAYVFLYHGSNAWVTPASIKGAWTPDGQWALFREVKRV